VTALIQQVLNGLVTGAGFVLVAVGLNVVFGNLGVVNFSHGALYVLGGYGAYTVTAQLGLPYWLGASIAAIGVALLAALLDPLVFRWLRGRGELAGIVATFGMALALQQITQLVWGADLLNVEAPFVSQAISLGPLFLNEQLALSVLVAAVLTLCVVAALKWTWLGLQVRALAADDDTAALMGVRTGRMAALTWALSGLLAGAAGAVLMPSSGLQPAVGLPIAVTAFTVVIAGGVGKMSGMVYTGLGLGVILSLVTGYLGSGLDDIVTFLVLLAVLIVRPQGIMGRAA